jgi:hypothetical protein
MWSSTATQYLFPECLLVYIPIKLWSPTADFIKGDKVICDNNKLPIEIVHLFGSHCSYDKIAKEEQLIFIKYQNYFDVWLPEFNVDGFNDLIAEIKEGLR